MKKIAIALAAVLSMSTAVPAYAGIGVMIDKKPVNFTTSTGSPVIDENGRTLVPLRATMEAFGCTVYWQESSKQAYVIEGNYSVVVPIGQRYIDVMHKIVPIDTAAKIIDGRVYLPIRAVLEAFNSTVGWDEKSQNVVVTTGNTPDGINDEEEWFEEQQKRIEEEIKQRQEEREREEEERRKEQEERQEELDRWREETLAEINKIRDEAFEYDKQMQKEIEKDRQEAIRKQQEAIYDSMMNTGGYANTYTSSLGYYNPNMFGGYESKAAEIAYQQYLDNLLVQSRYK